MLKLFRTKTFTKEYKKLKMSDQHYSKFISYVALLLEEKKLPAEALDHQLIGSMQDFSEFHVSGDLLVIYCIENEYLKLTRIGTHSQLFG